LETEIENLIRSLLILFILLFPLPVKLSSYYQIIPYLEDNYSSNTLDFGNWYNDNQQYKNLGITLKWNTGKEQFLFKGDITFLMFFKGNDKIYRNTSVFNEKFTYLFEPVNRKNLFNIRINIKEYYYAFLGDKLDFKIGFFPAEWSKISIDNTIIGSSFGYHFPYKSLSISMLAGGINRQFSDENGMLIDFSAQENGYQPSLPVGIVAWNIRLNEKNMDFVIFQGITKNISNFGAVFKGKKNKIGIDFLMASSVNNKDNTHGFAYLVEGVYLIPKGEFKCGYAEASGYDFSFKQDEKQLFYQPISPGLLGGYVFYSQLRNFSSIKYISYGVSQKINIINLNLDGFNYWDNTLYRENTIYKNKNLYLGNEIDFALKIDLGYYFTQLVYGFFLPGDRMNSLMKEAVYNYYSESYSNETALALAGEYEAKPVHKVNFRLGLRF